MGGRKIMTCIFLRVKFPLSSFAKVGGLPMESNILFAAFWETVQVRIMHSTVHSMDKVILNQYHSRSRIK